MEAPARIASRITQAHHPRVTATDAPHRAVLAAEDIPAGPRPEAIVEDRAAATAGDAEEAASRASSATSRKFVNKAVITEEVPHFQAGALSSWTSRSDEKAEGKHI